MERQLLKSVNGQTKPEGGGTERDGVTKMKVIPSRDL